MVFKKLEFPVFTTVWTQYVILYFVVTYNLHWLLYQRICFLLLGVCLTPILPGHINVLHIIFMLLFSCYYLISITVHNHVYIATT